MFFREPSMGRAAWKVVGEQVSGYRQASIVDEKDERTQKWGCGTRGGVSACHGPTFGDILCHGLAFGNASRPSRPAFTKSKPWHGMRGFLVPRRRFWEHSVPQSHFWERAPRRSRNRSCGTTRGVFSCHGLIFGNYLCHSPAFGNAGEKSWREGPRQREGPPG